MRVEPACAALADPTILTMNKTVPHLKNDSLKYKVEGEVTRKVR